MLNIRLFKKYLSILLLLFSALTLFPSQSFGNYSQNYFVVTAYYSPLPEQDYYLTGNYKDEIRLNGHGVRGAGGKEVFSGMFAAPSKYDFGTKIFLEGLGAGSVEDRGGAIVPAGKRGYDHDRIDIWVGYGDEGLRRALYWGKRKISGSIISGGSDVTFDYKKIPSPLWVTKGFRKISDIFSLNIGVNSNYKNVLSLQKFFTKIGLYEGDMTGKYNSAIMDIVFEFQMRNKLVTGEGSLGAGYWGNKTRNLFLKKYLNGDFEKNVIKSDDYSELDKVDTKYNTLFEGALNTKAKIVLLQELLIELDIYDGDKDGIYLSIKDLILTYQLNNNVISSKNSLGAGVFGPKTRKSFNEFYLDYKEGEIRKNDLEFKYKELELIAENEANNKIDNIGAPIFGEISSSVRDLQKTLKLLGFFNYSDTAFFGNITKKSIITFQLDNKIISSSSELGAGIFGPKTKKSLKNNLKKHLLNSKVETEKLDKQLLLDIGVWSL